MLQSWFESIRTFFQQMSEPQQLQAIKIKTHEQPMARKVVRRRR